jgi:hypothetical protein
MVLEKDFDTNFKRYQDRKGKGDNMIESKEKTLTLIQKIVNILYLCTLVLTFGSDAMSLR